MGKILTMAHHILGWIWEVIEEIFMGEKLPMEEIMPKPKVETPQEMLLEASRQYVGEDASPEDLIDDSVACAISVCKVVQCLYSDFPDIAGTWTLWQYLVSDKRFRGSLDLEPGNIWIFPTGTGNGKIRGHVFIIGEDGKFYGNSSFTGIWDSYYTKEEIISRYVTLGKLKQYIFEPIDMPN